LWERLGIGAALRRVADGRRLDGEATERVIFALVAQRALELGSKLAATRWVAERVAIEGCPGFSEDAAYAAMDFLLDALGEIASEIFASVAHLLNLDVEIIFVDTTSTYWEVEVADELTDLDDDPIDDDGVGKPVESGIRTFGKSKDHRNDLPQVVIAMAVTRDGIPVRCWTFPGNGSDDGTRTERFVVCHNPEAAARDAAVRDRLIEHLEALIEGSDAWPTTRRDEFVGSLKTKPGLRRYLRRTRSGLLRIDRAAANREAHLDGKW